MKYIPNILTGLRLVCVPAFILLYIYGANYGNTQMTVWAILIFIFASLTDILDGYLARKYNAVSKFGIVCDPLADKLLQISAMFCVCYLGRFPVWALVIVMMKEGVMVCGATFLVFHKEYVMANKFGKIATLIIAVFLLAVMIFWNYIAPYIDILSAVVIIPVLAALVSYSVKFIQVLRLHYGKNREA